MKAPRRAFMVTALASTLGAGCSSPSTHCEFDVPLDEIPTAGEVEIFDIGTQRPGFADHHAYIASFNGAWALAELAISASGSRLRRRTSHRPGS